MVKQDVQLAVNCGSSSIKFTLFNEDRQVILTGQADNVQGDSPASYSYKYAPSFNDSSSKQDSYDLSEKKEQELDAKTTYEDVFEEILKDVTSEQVLGKDGKNRIKLIAHRIVHGGTADGPIVIKHGDKEEKEVLDRMEEVSSFAPLHVCSYFFLSRTK
jgi:acetate kinase